MEIVGLAGHTFLRPFRYTARWSTMGYLAFRSLFFNSKQNLRAIFRVIASQIYFTGFQALPLIGLLAAACGGVVVIQSTSGLSGLGGGSVMGSMIVLIVVRELGPLITALVVIARSGVAVATEVGNMKVNRETDALECIGISPLSYVIFPRVAGGVVSVLCLAIYFVGVALLFGYLIAHFTQQMQWEFYVDSIAQSLVVSDAFIFLLKNIFSGITIFVVACYQGLSVQQSSHEVPQATTRAVVHIITYVVGFNLLVSIAFYLQKFTQMGLL